MNIDIYSHILPPKYKKKLHGTAGFPARQRQTHDSVPILSDLEYRVKSMETYPDLMQVLTLGPPALECYFDPVKATELAKAANDELAEIVEKYPDNFIAGVATLPMNDMDSAMSELERALKDLHLKGVQIYTPVNNSPLDLVDYSPLFAMMVSYDLPIWVHPQRPADYADYTIEKKSKYEAYKVFGWPYETTIAMTRIVYSGIMEKFPNLKIITHHGGGMIPYFSHRMERFYELNDIRKWGDYEPRLQKNPVDYFKKFYIDTAVDGNTAALNCAFAFFGADQILFGTDMHSEQQINETIASINNMDLPDSEKKKIFELNAKRILRLI